MIIVKGLGTTGSTYVNKIMNIFDGKVVGILLRVIPFG